MCAHSPIVSAHNVAALRNSVKAAVAMLGLNGCIRQLNVTSRGSRSMTTMGAVGNSRRARTRSMMFMGILSTRMRPAGGATPNASASA